MCWRECGNGEPRRDRFVSALVWWIGVWFRADEVEGEWDPTEEVPAKGWLGRIGGPLDNSIGTY